MKVAVVLPAYNAEKTLARTLKDIPASVVDMIILVDDASTDNTVAMAKNLGLEVFEHELNRGYGANQKTCYEKALEKGAEIIIMLHPDYQYDPKIIPQLIEPIENAVADAVFGSRMLKGGALEGGMPLWKHMANIISTAFENFILAQNLSEYHSGFRAYSAEALRSVDFSSNSDNFVFDTEIIVQLVIKKMRIMEIPIKTRYFDEASSIKFFQALIYGVSILKTMFQFLLFKNKICKFKKFI